MKKINITIDEKKIQVDSGITILKAVRDNNIADIPTLCYDPELPPYGSCFLCVVEVEGFPRLLPACSSPVGEGMVIKTNSEKVIDTRKTALELLLSEHFADCDAPCEIECPAHVDVQGYIALISRGLHREAIELIRKTNPLPVTCGRICVRKCEIKCRRSIIDETAVGINYLKRYASDVERNIHIKETVKGKKTEKIAIIGGGPSGLTAAYFLAKEGYRITVFDMMPKLGGMLRYGIPEYRLPKNILDHEIQFIVDLGVEVKINTKLGVDFTIESLKKDGYKSIYLALGAWKSQSMRLSEEDKIKGVIPGIKYLRENQMGTSEKLSGNVVIVGGGNTAIDAARTSLREKEVNEVTIIYRRTKKEMPADPLEINAAEEEGVKFEFLVSPLELIANNRLKGIRCQKMELGEPDSSGRRRPIPIKGSNFDIQCDYLISAIGQKADAEGIAVELSRWGTVVIDEDTLQSSIEGVFAGGDVVLGPSVVIDAIAHGQRAAKSISQFLQAGKIEKTKRQFQSRRDSFGVIPRDYYQDISLKGRTKMDEEPVEKRIKDNREVELGISDDDVEVESSRCLECGCLINDRCILRKYCTEYEIDISDYSGEIRISNLDNSHPFISLDQNKCILCGRCVRTCNEIVGSGVYGFVDRGFYTEVRPTLNRNLVETECISCGNCIDACPTGAILQSNLDVKPVPRSVKKLPLNCGYCSVGCEMYLDFTPGGIQSVSSDRDGNIKGPGKGLLCFNGRFGLSYAVDKNRIIKPFIKKESKHEEVSLDIALEKIHRELKNVIEESGPESVGIFASPKMTLEEYYLLRKLSDHIGSDNFGSLNYLLSGIDLQELNTSCGFTSSYARFEDLENSDYIVAFGSIERKNPVAAMRINIAINNGAELFLINPVENSTLEKKASLVFRFKDNSEKYLFASLIRQVSESKISNWDLIEKKTNGFFELKESVQNMSLRKLEKKTGLLRRFLKKFINSLSDDSKNVVIIINPDEETVRSEQTLSLITSYMIISGRFFRDNNGLILTRSHCNSQGIAFTFINDNPLELQEMIKTQKIKAAIIFGENPLVEDKFRSVFGNINFLVSCDMFENETTSISDVILPFSAYFESDGSFITSENKLKSWNKVVESPAGLTNIEIIKYLAEKFSCGIEDDINTIRRNIINDYQLDDIIFAEDLNIDNNNIKHEKFPTFDGKANLWPFNEKTPSVKIELNKYVSLDKWLEKFKKNNSIA